MCTVDIQSATAEIRRGKKKEEETTAVYEIECLHLLRRTAVNNPNQR